jgi:hypothetical protein
MLYSAKRRSQGNARINVVEKEISDIHKLYGCDLPDALWLGRFSGFLVA